MLVNGSKPELPLEDNGDINHAIAAIAEVNEEKDDECPICL